MREADDDVTPESISSVILRPSHFKKVLGSHSDGVHDQCMHTVSEIFVWPVSPTSSSLEHCTSLPKVCVGVKLKLEVGWTDGEGNFPVSAP